MRLSLSSLPLLSQVASLDQLTNFDAFVKANKEYFTDQTDVAGQLIEQMKRNVNDAESLLTQNSDKLIDLVKRDGAVSQARKEFQDGVETYKKDQQNKAILGICKAVLEVGASVAAMAAGNESRCRSRCRWGGESCKGWRGSGRDG